MEKTYINRIVPLILLLFMGCSMDHIHENVDKEGEYGFNFRESKIEWEKLKARNGNSYIYSVMEESFTGRGSETTITVVRGRVISRYFEAYLVSENDGTKEVLYTYREESKNELGSHQEGALPLTMDELYRSCVSQYLIADPDSNEVYFETNDRGIMMLCGFVPFGCQDDCYRGIRISHFSWK